MIFVCHQEYGQLATVKFEDLELPEKLLANKKGFLRKVLAESAPEACGVSLFCRCVMTVLASVAFAGAAGSAEYQKAVIAMSTGAHKKVVLESVNLKAALGRLNSSLEEFFPPASWPPTAATCELKTKVTALKKSLAFGQNVEPFFLADLKKYAFFAHARCLPMSAHAFVCTQVCTGDLSRAHQGVDGSGRRS